jgi:hypothetical protein
MSGNNIHIILQKRDSRLMHTLATLRLVDRKQAQSIAGFASITRVNARLLKLTKAGLLKRFFFVSALGGKKAVYIISKKGAALLGVTTKAINRPADSFLIGDKFVSHQLAINQVYCAACHGTDANDHTVWNWRSLHKPFSSAIPIIPDGYFEIQISEMIRPMFLEVDQGTESLSVWTKKTSEYLNLAASGEFERLFQKPRFAVLVIASSDRRMHSLRTHIRKATSKIFYFSTHERITLHGFWGLAWFRPEGEQPQSLT